MSEPKDWWLGARSHELEEHAALVLGEVPLQHVPEPADDAVRVVEPAVVLRVAPQVAQVQRHVVAAHQPLELRRGEQGQPLWVDDSSEPFDEGVRLVLDLGVHSEVRH